ncbi:MAG: APC family permease, partial [Polyangiaceae bacterium]
DGLSSSAYGPDEAFRALGEHTGLAFFLAVATACTVFIISYGYSRIIEQFPSGGGGYVVSTRLLGEKTGLVSGAALLVDYVLTITTSMASGADAIFSFLPAHAHAWKLPVTFVGLGILTLLNLRGVKESVTALVPIFTVFLVTHAILLIVSIGGHLGAIAEVSHEVRTNIGESVSALGTFGALKLFLRSYSMGGGTYTGIEAVSNGVPMMREPRVQTAQRTMILMALSLAITAGGIILAYLLMHAHPEPGKTMNAVLLDRAAGHWNLGGIPLGRGFIIVTLLSEGTLLFVAAQAGFLDGPRVMANMAIDSWLPHRFAALSDRLAMNNGIMLMAGAAAGALIYTRGNVSKLVVMYSINVFLTFSLSNLAMTRHWIRERAHHPRTWWQHLPAHVIALVLCATILVVTVLEKFSEGCWLTLLVTALLVGVCLLIRRHYRVVLEALQQLDLALPSPAEVEHPLPDAPSLEAARYDEGPTRICREHHNVKDPEPRAHVAILFVAGYSGLGRHAVLTLLRLFPRYFGGIVFVSVALLDSEAFKGADQVEALERRTRETLMKY